MGLGKIPKLPHKAPRPRRRSRLHRAPVMRYTREDWVIAVAILGGGLSVAGIFVLGFCYGFMLR